MTKIAPSSSAKAKPSEEGVGVPTGVPAAAVAAVAVAPVVAPNGRKRNQDELEAAAMTRQGLEKKHCKLLHAFRSVHGRALSAEATVEGFDCMLWRSLESTLQQAAPEDRIRTRQGLYHRIVRIALVRPGTNDLEAPRVAQYSKLLEGALGEKMAVMEADWQAGERG